MSSILYLYESTVQLHQHTSLLSFHWWWSRCTLTGGCFHAYITHWLHLKIYWQRSRSQMLMRGQGRNTALCLCAGEQCHCNAHLFQGSLVFSSSRNTISSNLLSISAVRFELRYSCNWRKSEQLFCILYNKSGVYLKLWDKVFSWKPRVKLIQELHSKMGAVAQTHRLANLISGMLGHWPSRAFRGRPWLILEW